MRSKGLSIGVVFALFAMVGCSAMPAPSAPSPTTSILMSSGLGGGGTWVSTSATTTPTSCSGFKWTISDATLTSVAGSFSATCYGMPLAGTGTARATIAGSAISWTGTATASVPGHSSCNIALSGSVELSGSQIRIPYSGTTCLGPVSGTEVLGRQ